jgi:hypothetical protein
MELGKGKRASTTYCKQNFQILIFWSDFALRSDPIDKKTQKDGYNSMSFVFLRLATLILEQAIKPVLADHVHPRGFIILTKKHQK